jgi:uncharacterized membrane protein YidH (DUF202 family)
VGGGLSVWLGAALIALGTLSNASATVRYLAVRRAIVEDRAVVPGNTLVVTLAFGLVTAGAVLFAYVVAR